MEDTASQQASSAVSAASSQASVSAASGKKDAFLYPDYPPCMEAIEGVAFDFACGARILAPKEGRMLHCILTDRDSGTVLHDARLQPGHCVSCSKKFYMNYRLMLGDEDTHEIVYTHDFDMRGRDVLVQLPVDGAMGDSIAWFSVVERFSRQYGAVTHVLMPERIRTLVEKQYPELVFETLESAREKKFYAIYYLGLFFHDDVDWQPYDFRLMSLAEVPAQILGLDDMSIRPPRMSAGPPPEDFGKPYVCIAVHGSSHAKHWNNPAGWRGVIAYLKSCGYEVVCIDKDPEVGVGDVWHCIPNGCLDRTGNRPLQERFDMLSHAAFFIGLPSGLSWLAWCSGIPVVMISGFSMPFGEFPTPYRVQCRHSCHGCWNDTRYEFDHSDFMWCPRHKGTPRAYECTKHITVKMVTDAIARIPGVLTPRVECADEPSKRTD